MPASGQDIRPHGDHTPKKRYAFSAQKAMQRACSCHSQPYQVPKRRHSCRCIFAVALVCVSWTECVKKDSFCRKKDTQGRVYWVAESERQVGHLNPRQRPPLRLPWQCTSCRNAFSPPHRRYPPPARCWINPNQHSRFEPSLDLSRQPAGFSKLVRARGMMSAPIQVGSRLRVEEFVRTCRQHRAP